MGVVNNPLIDSYYYPLGLKPDLEAMRKDFEQVRDEVVRSLEQRVERARQHNRHSDVIELNRKLDQIRLMTL